ncbi:unnamed protein product [Chrysodeixis includens]|uniref:long-chain-fatty-acid--CoA ligase n=1 Tax=Chrysodeixis includens TaxID=689277 RepID=A0A9P0C350_CHRIL|nr:unnamed protein product [Chrysodeixis includens]
MAAIDITVDNNMNKTDINNQKFELKATDADLEKGDLKKEKQREESESTIPWSKIIIGMLALGVLVAACAVTWVFQDWQTSLQVLAILAVVYCIAFYWRWLYVAALTAPRDFSALWCYIKILWLTRNFTNKKWSMPDIFHQMVLKHPTKACFLFEDETWTFKQKSNNEKFQVEDYSLRSSAVLKSEGVKRGDTVAVMIGNCPEMPAIWLGATRLGAVAPLINTNQTGNTLLHSINVAKCDVVIYSDEFAAAFQDIAKELNPSIKLYKFTRRPLNTSPDAVRVVETSNDFTAMLESVTPAPWSQADSDGFNAKLLYIYTSGTTGLPKAAVISSSRMVFMASGVHYLGSLRASDVIYCPMPLYHSAGGCITMGQAFIFGCTIVLKTKFSASAYFPDCIKYKATVAHYIGEMCRYVLATPPAATDRQHKVRTVYGNGMRPAIWTDFVKRFNIKKVVEFYGATEGNANIVNINNRTGAIGFVSRIIPAVYPIAILKVDPETGDPIRDKKGLCQLAQPNQPGVFIGKIKPNNPSRAFLGYVDKDASDKKIVRDVFTFGDSAFISVNASDLNPHITRTQDKEMISLLGQGDEFIRIIHINSNYTYSILDLNHLLQYVPKLPVTPYSIELTGHHESQLYTAKINNIKTFLGDILMADELGYLFFMDRTGDTFRWRGENVSTTEVESAISRVADQRDAVVYGVEIPNTDGRAGMCGIVDTQGSLDLEKLAKDIAKDLPKYARPIFIRIMTSVDMTGTFKMRKIDLQKEGYNPSIVKDKLFYLDPKTGKYVPLGNEEYEKIISGQIRL